MYFVIVYILWSQILDPKLHVDDHVSQYFPIQVKKRIHVKTKSGINTLVLEWYLFAIHQWRAFIVPALNPWPPEPSCLRTKISLVNLSRKGMRSLICIWLMLTMHFLVEHCTHYWDNDMGKAKWNLVCSIHYNWKVIFTYVLLTIFQCDTSCIQA